MKKNVLHYIILMCLLFISICRAFSQGNGNSILDFTNLNDPAVTCYYGYYSDPFDEIGIVNGRHTVISSQGYDDKTGYQLPYLPPGENRVIRLGNSSTGSQAEAIRYRFTVDYFKPTLLLKFAVVFEDPGHPAYQQPRFTVRVTNTNGQLVESCAEYDVTAAGNIPGFNSYGGTRWRPWTNVGIDLSPYIGSEVIVEFITKDCDQSGHFGYAYFTASCISNYLDIVQCNGNDIILKAPDNFSYYKWSNNSTNQQTQITVTGESMDVHCDVTSVTGCTFRLNAHITNEAGVPTQDTIIHDTICVGNTYTKNFFNLPAQNNIGDFTFINTVGNLNNCTYTTTTLLLNVTDEVNTYIYDNICYGDSYNDNGFSLDSVPLGVNVFQQYLTSISGCDSTVYLYLNVVQNLYDTLFVDTICQWDSYLQNGFVFDSMPAGNYFDTLFLNTIYGCDSIVKLNLTVNPTYDSLIYDTICQGDSYIQNGFVFNSMPAGNYFDSLFLNTIYGCDSIVKLNLFVRPSFDTLIFDAICYGDNYLENNFNIIAPPSGLYQDTLFLNNIHGCDSIVRLNLTVNPSYDIEINENICQGEDYIENGFVFEDMTPGYYSETLFLNTIYGCDSIVKLNLTVSPNYDIEINDVACQGDDYLENGFVIESLQNGTYSETLFLNSIHGCDSVVKLNLTVNESFHFEIYDSICYGEDYTMYGLNLTEPNVGIDNYTSNFQTILGCDSIFDVTLKVLDVYDEIEIDGEQVLLVSTNLTTGCYLYTVGENEEDRTYSWEIDNEDWKIAPNNNECLLWATTPEKCTLTVTGGNSCGTVSDAIELTADFFDEVNTSKVMMYPNPAKNYINIKHNDISRINVYDSYGQLILRNDYNLNNQVMLNLNSLESSIYILEIITPERTFIERISIIK